MSTPPVAVREASVMMVKGLATSGIAKMGFFRKASQMVSKAFWHSLVQDHVAPFFVRSWSGRAMVEKSGINFL